MLAIILVNSTLGIATAIDASGRRRTRSDGNRSWNTGNFSDHACRNRDLIIISARGNDKTQLVFRVHIVNQRSKSPEAVRRIVKDRWRWRLEPEIAAISAQASVIGKSLRVPSATDLVVCLVETSEARDQIAFVIAFKAGARHYVEY